MSTHRLREACPSTLTPAEAVQIGIEGYHENALVGTLACASFVKVVNLMKEEERSFPDTELKRRLGQVLQAAHEMLREAGDAEALEALFCEVPAASALVLNARTPSTMRFLSGRAEEITLEFLRRWGETGAPSYRGETVETRKASVEFQLSTVNLVWLYFDQAAAYGWLHGKDRELSAYMSYMASVLTTATRYGDMIGE